MMIMMSCRGFVGKVCKNLHHYYSAATEICYCNGQQDFGVALSAFVSVCMWICRGVLKGHVVAWETICKSNLTLL